MPLNKVRGRLRLAELLYLRGRTGERYRRLL